MPTLRESELHQTDSFKLSRTQYKMIVKPLVVTTAHGRTHARTDGTRGARGLEDTSQWGLASGMGGCADILCIKQAPLT